MDAQRALLDELMGTGKVPTRSPLARMTPARALSLPLTASRVLSFAARNLTEEEKKGHKELKWDDPDVCGPYMVRFCPHDLFVNTKSNIGTAIPSFLFLMRFAVIFFYS